MKLAYKSYLRLKDILKRDKELISSNLLEEVKSDIFSVINQYFDCSITSFSLNYIIDDRGKYKFELLFDSNGIKKNNFF